MIELIFFLAFIWGVSFALFLQYVPAGRFLAKHRAWLAVVIGVGVDVLILAWVLPVGHLLMIFAVFGASAIGVIARSLANERNEIQDALSYVKETTGKTR